MKEFREYRSLPIDFKDYECCWRAPSNIAIVKYWGKYDYQLPRNPNFSFTLKKSHTETKVYFSKRKTNWVDIYLDGEPKEGFLPKVENFLGHISTYYPFVKGLHLKIDTHNTFPYGTGIASSASSMAALALCLCTLRKDIFSLDINSDKFFTKASFFARLGSGSACRSLFPNASVWGDDEVLFARGFEDGLHSNFKEIRDSIIIVSSDSKKVPSSFGHDRMGQHFFKERRYSQAKCNWKRLKNILWKGDFEEFWELCEGEALSLHAMMMTSSPSYFLLRPETLLIMEKVRDLRKQGYPLCFTLDAGPNIHILYQNQKRDIVYSKIVDEILPLVPNSKCIHDELGKGPEQL